MEKIKKIIKDYYKNKDELLLCISELYNIFIGLVLIHKEESTKILILLLIQSFLILINFINIDNILKKYNKNKNNKI